MDPNNGRDRETRRSKPKTQTDPVDKKAGESLEFGLKTCPLPMRSTFRSLGRHVLGSVLSLALTVLAPAINAAGLGDEDLFQSDRLLEVRITIDEEKWNELRLQSRDFRSAFSEDRRSGPPEKPYSYFTADVEINGETFENVGVRKKGFIGSLSETRPSLKLKLNHETKGVSIDGITHLTLNNNRQDGSLLSQFLSYRVFREAGSPAPRCSYAQVYVNGESLGVYSHVESMKKPMMDREFGSDDGVLYEGTVVDFHTDWEMALEHKFGDDEVGRERIKELIEVLNRTEGLDSPAYVAEIGETVDLDSFYTFWALEGLMGFWDGYSGNSNNYFFYLNPETDRFHFLPWGADSLFSEGRGPFRRGPDAPVSVKIGGLIAYRLYQNAEGRARYEQELRRVLDEAWDPEALLAEADRVTPLIEPFIHPEQSRMQGEGESVRAFIRGRKDRILEEIADGAVDWDPGKREPFGRGGGRGPGGGGGFVRPQKEWKPGERELIGAAKEGDVAEIRKRIAEGVAVDTRDERNGTALSSAVMFGNPDAITALLELGADPNLRGFAEMTYLHTAARFGILSAVEPLIEGGCDVNAKDAGGQTALDLATAPWSEDLERRLNLRGLMTGRRLDVSTIRDQRPQLIELLKANGATLGSESP